MTDGKFLRIADVAPKASPEFPPGLYRIVDDAGLQHATNNGARLVRVLDREAQIYYQDTEWQEPSYPGGQRYMQPVNKARFVQTNQFLVYTPLSVEEIVEGLRKQVQSNDAAADAARRAEAKAGEERDRATKLVAEREKELQRERESCSNYLTRQRELQTQLQRMECDLAKLRSAIGEIEMKKILGG